MKKLLVLLISLGIVQAYAQNTTGKKPAAKTTRMILMEEFTNASCGPCAAANPAFNALIDANPNVVAIKYQTNWPGTDPMNAQNPTDVATRVTYYGVTGVPNAEMDGNVQNTHPASLTQAMITTEGAVSAPFDMVLTHSLSAGFDSIFIKCVYTATAAVTMTTPVIHVAITEQQIHFASAPGSNGETDFYEVMRKMLPSASGTTIATSWTIGQMDSISFAVPIPSYIYDKAQLACVSWIQDNSNKNVKQAAYSEPIPFKTDAALTAANNILFLNCASTISPIVRFKNAGSDTLSKLNIHYKIDSGVEDSIIWTGSKLHNDTASVNLPVLTLTPGSHVFTAFVYMTNNAIDLNHKNDTVKAKCNYINSYGSYPISEGFQGTTFPATNFIINNPDNDYAWAKATVGGFGTSNASAKINFYDISSGKVDELILPPVSLAPTATNLAMSFDLAYAQYSASYVDKLEVQLSTDCGATWNNVYNKSGANLATITSVVTSAFTPTAAQWRKELVSLSSYIGQSQVILKFKATSGYGNNLYIDNIFLATDAGVSENNAISVNIFPNPASNNVNITNAKDANIAVYDMFGKLVYSANKITDSYSIDLTSFANGTYMIQLTQKDKVITQKLSVVK